MPAAVALSKGSQQSAVSVSVSVQVRVKGQEEGQSLAELPDLVSRLHCCAYASDSTANKALTAHCTDFPSFKSRFLVLHVQSLLLLAHCFVAETGYCDLRLS